MTGGDQSVWLTDYRLDDWSWIPGRVKSVLCHHWIQSGSGAHPASCQVGNGALYRGAKRPKREAKQSSAQRENMHEARYKHVKPIQRHSLFQSDMHDILWNDSQVLYEVPSSVE
jgi:hypothetical protein